jgi:glycosyltransferase involved in cell wall biosynthesis
MEKPYVSLLIPCRNEEKFISDCLDSLLKNDYPIDKTEILVIDGISDDSTVRIVEEYISRNSNIRLLSNSKRVFPAAVNIGITESKGELIFIMGAHAIYPEEYISKCVKSSLELNSENVGGILNTIPIDENMMGRMISYVLSNSFGVGNSTFRTGHSEIIEVDTVFGGCYKRDVFDRIGNFNENLVSTSDMEFNTRLKRSGGKIYLIPDIIANYYTRSTFTKFMQNNFRNGFWAIYPLRFVDIIPVSLRHFIPLMFLVGIICGILLSFVSNIFLYILLSVLSLYIVASIIASFEFLKKNIISGLVIPSLFLMLHISYGIGSLIGLIKVLVHKRFYVAHLFKK